MVLLPDLKRNIFELYISRLNHDCKNDAIIKYQINSQEPLNHIMSKSGFSRIFYDYKFRV